jgi:WD40 repeat protein
MASPRTLQLAIAGSLLLLFRAMAGEPGLDSFGDRLPPYAVARLGTARLRHGQPVSGLTFSPDGKSLLSVGWGEASLSTIRLWDAADGKEKWSVGQRFASCAAFAPDGRSIAVGGGVGMVRLVQAEVGREVRKLAGDQGAVSAVAFGPDAKRVFTAGGSGKLHLWDAANGDEVRAFIGHDGEVLSLALSADGKTLASSGADGTLRLWEVENGKESLKIALPHATDALALSPDGKFLFAPGDDGKVRRWTASGKELAPLNAGDKPVQRLALSGDGQTLATGADGLIQIQDVETGKTIGRIARPAGDVPALALTADGKAVAAAGVNYALHIWDVATSKERFAAQGHTDAVTAVAYSPQGRVAATASEDGTVRTWDAAAGKPLRTCDGERLRPSFLVFSADGATLASGGQGGEIRIWDVATGCEVRRVGKIEDAAPKCAALSPDGKTLALADDKNPIRLFDAVSGEAKAVLEGSTKRIVFLAFSPDGRTLASASEGDAVRLWDAEKGRELNRFPKLIDATALAIGTKGRWLAVGRADGLVYILEAASGKTIRVLSGHSGPVSALTFTRDGRLLASGGPDHVLAVWETATGTELLALAGHSGAVRAVAFSPDGRTLLSGGADGVGLIWDVTRGPQGGEVRRQTLTPADLAKRWADLLSEDGPTANGALWDLAAAPEQSVPFIHDQMRPLFGGDAQRAAKLIVDLDDDAFDVRERASAGLAAMGSTIGPLLKQALAATTSSEVRQRLEVLLSKLKEAVPWGRERQRVFRALTVLEQSGAPAAREVLEATAKGAVEPELKQAARDALERLPAPPKP